MARRFILRLLWAVVETVWFLLVLILLILWVLPDFFRKRR